jgi:hypothetical protein
MSDDFRWWISGFFAGITFVSFLLAIVNLYRLRLPRRLTKPQRYRYFVSYRIFNNGIEERGGYRIVQSRQSPSEIDDAFFTAIGKAMGVQFPLEIQFTAFNRL